MSQIEVTTVFPSAAYGEGANNSADQTNSSWRGARLFLNITNFSNAGTLNVKVQVKDTVSLQYIDMPDAAFATKSISGFDELTIYPGAIAVANRVVSKPVGRTWRAVATVSAGITVTFTLVANYLA